MGVRGIGVRFETRKRDFSVFYKVKIGSGAHPAFYSADTVVSLNGCKISEA
jgi:hypothetical protein